MKNKHQHHQKNLQTDKKVPTAKTTTASKTARKKVKKFSLGYSLLILRRSFGKIIGLFLLSFLSAFLLFIAILSPLTFNNYKNNSLNNYGYNSYVSYNTSPINSVTFNRNSYEKPEAKTSVKGNYSNHIGLANTDLQSEVDRHSFLISEMRNAFKLRNSNPTAFKAALQAIFNQIQKGLGWLGGTITTTEWIHLMNELFNAGRPECFKFPAPATCTYQNAQLLAALISGPTGLKIAFVIDNYSDKKVDFDKYPVDATLIPDSNIKLTKVGIWSSTFYGISEADYTKYKNENRLTEIKGPGDIITQTLVDYAPASVTKNIFNNPNFLLTYNLVGYNKDENSLMTDLDSADDKSALWGLSIEDNNKLKLLDNNQNNLLPRLQATDNFGPNSYMPVVVNKSYSFLHNLKTGDNFNYTVKVPVVERRSSPTSNDWKPVTDLSKFLINPTPNTFPSMYYGGTTADDSMSSLVARGLLRVTNLNKTIKAKIVGVSTDSSTPRVFAWRQKVNQFMWHVIGIEGNGITALGGQPADINAKSYFNAKFSLRDFPTDVTNFELTQPFGIYTKFGLQGGTQGKLNYPKLGSGIINSVYSVSAAKKGFDQLATIVNALIYVASSFLILFSIIFIAVSVNITLTDNKKTILMYKTFGYSNREIANRFINLYFFVVLFAFLVAIPASYFTFLAVMNSISHAEGFYISVTLVWWEPIVSFSGSLVILFINYMLTFNFVNKINLAIEWRTHY